MPISFPLTIYGPRANVLMRLTAADTRFLKSRIEDAVAKGKGVNLIIHDLRSAFCIINTDERGQELSITTHADSLTYRVESPQKGYTGPWSHVEIVMDRPNGLKALEGFLEKTKNPVGQGKLWQQET